MREGQINESREVLEHIPSQKDIERLFERMVKEDEYKELRKLEDEKGIYLWEIEVVKEDGNLEYNYMRKGKYKEGQSATTAINVIFYDTDGMPISGDLVAEYNETAKKWEVSE